MRKLKARLPSPINTSLDLRLDLRSDSRLHLRFDLRLDFPCLLPSASCSGSSVTACWNLRRTRTTSASQERQWPTLRSGAAKHSKRICYLAKLRSHCKPDRIKGILRGQRDRRKRQVGGRASRGEFWEHERKIFADGSPAIIYRLSPPTSRPTFSSDVARHVAWLK